MDENKENNNRTYNDEKVLRTYTSDMAEAIKEKEMSVIKIALAEKEKKEETLVENKINTKNYSKIFFIAGGVMLLAGAFLGISILKQKTKPPTTIEDPKTNKIEAPVSTDSQLFVDITKITNVGDLNSLIKKDQKEKTKPVKSIIFTTQTENGIENLTAKNLFSQLKINAPGTFIRSLADNFLFGKYYSQNNVDKKENGYSFLIFQTTNYDQAYASMLEWEQSMPKDLSILFDLNISSSQSIKHWRDIVIENRDARVYYEQNGQQILYYIFLNNNIIISDNLECLKEMAQRILIKK